MSACRGIFLIGALLTTAVVSQQLQQNQGQCDAPLGQEECDNGTAVKISQLFILRHDLLKKKENVRILKEDICETKTLLRNLEIQLNETLKRMEKREMDIRNVLVDEHRLNLSQFCDDNTPKDCCQIKTMFPSAKSGLYAISVTNEMFSSSKLAVYCDMETDGGGWIVIQRRNASMGWVNFARNFIEYELGFGDLEGEFWLGLKNMYELTNQDSVELKLKVWNATNSSINWNYPYFRVSDLRQSYQITTTRGSGNSIYSAFGNQGRTLSFRTYDNLAGSCPYLIQSGWWCYYRYYNRYSCDYANLNGLHRPSGIPGTDPVRERLVWRTASNTYEIFTHSEMKIRPQSCRLS